MKRVFSFLRSMTFGMILLAAILLCSFAGSMIPQQQNAMTYVNAYGETAARIVLALGLDDVFSAPYFIVLMAALCLNLTLCSVIRVTKLRGAQKRLLAQAENMAQKTVSKEAAQRIGAYFESRRYRQAQSDRGTIYYAHTLGFCGSFLTHLALILLLIVGGMTLGGATVMDETVMPGQTLTLDTGAQIALEDFRIEDETGRLDYASTLTLTLPDGAASEKTLVRVNEPLSFGGYKVYQQTYGTAGCIELLNTATGGSESVYLTESVFLTPDGQNGVYFLALYPGYTQDADGNYTLITSTSGAYSDPVYDLRVLSDGQTTAVLAFPGETLTVGDIQFTMKDAVSYPGLRIKILPSWVLGALYASFAFMIAALYVCFFMRPVCVCVSENGYAIASAKQQMDLQMAIDALTEEEKP